MAESPVNTQIDVLLAAAGAGSRMTSVNPALHKGLLPFREVPILWNIVSQIPPDLELGIAVGHRADQLRSFCASAMTDRAITFIEVDDWESDHAGTSYSLFCSEPYLKSSFWYLPCDGVFDGEVFERELFETTYFVQTVREEESEQYQTFRLENDGRIASTHFKEAQRSPIPAFTGVMWVADKKEFFDKLRVSNAVEFAESIGLGERTENLATWVDLGNPAAYHRAVEREREYDFTKPDELTFVMPNQIVKWFEDPAIAEKKLIKPQKNPTVYPSNTRVEGQFLRYDKVEGDTLYSNISRGVFQQLFGWLRENLWHASDKEISMSCELFYKEKTFRRLELMESALKSRQYDIASVDGYSVKSGLEYLRQIDFDKFVSSGVASEIHGDLQFDNIIYDSRSGRFCLIDWRPSFGNELLVGDLYYDLGKLLGGIRLDYRQVKQNNFAIREADGDVFLTTPVCEQSAELEEIFQIEVNKMGLDFSRVEHLVPIIYMNMAPLHTEPFARFVWAMALKGFATLE